MAHIIPLLGRRPAPVVQAAAPAADDKLNPLRGQMLSSVNFYHSARISGADSKAASLMAVSGVGIGLLSQRAKLSAEADILAGLVQHPSLVLLFAAIALAALSLRPVRAAGGDWQSRLIGGEPPTDVTDLFLRQEPAGLFADWIASQAIIIAIAKRKYRLINLSMVAMLGGFGLVLLGL